MTATLLAAFACLRQCRAILAYLLSQALRTFVWLKDHVAKKSPIHPPPTLPGPHERGYKPIGEFQGESGMSKTALLSTTVLALTLGCTLRAPVAQAADPVAEVMDNWYVSVFGGASFSRAHASYFDDVYDIRLNDGFSVGAAIGNHIENDLRFERELSYVRNGNDATRFDTTFPFDALSGHTDAVFLLANLWKDIDLGAFSPYVGGGLGAAFLSSKGSYAARGAVATTNGWDDSEIGLAIQLGAGLRFALNDRIAIDAGYRLRAVIDASFDRDPTFRGENGAFSFYSHSAQLGVSYALGENSQIMPPATGDSSWYVSLFGGVVFPDDSAFNYGTVYSIDNKTGFTIGAAVGTQLSPGLRGELELSYLRHALDSYSTDANSRFNARGDLDQGYLMLNVWKDFDLGMISPYIGGGLGIALADFDNVFLNGNRLSSHTGYGMAGQFGFGARMGLTDNIAVDVGYRFKSQFDTFIEGGGNLTDNAELATYNHVVQLGVTYGIGEGANVSPGATPMGSRYVSVFGGLVVPLDTHVAVDASNYMVDFKDGFTVGAAIGGEVARDLRGEIEVSYVGYDVDHSNENGTRFNSNGDVDSYFLLANLWRDFHLGMFQPYLGGGVGMALMDVDLDFDPGIGEHSKDTTLAFAAQAGSGIRFDVTDTIAIDLGYRFKAALGVLTEGNAGNDDHSFASYFTHIGQAGITWKF
jgi:opacity protein-like surface antigen